MTRSFLLAAAVPAMAGGIAAPATPAGHRSTLRQCTLVVDGKRLVDGRCHVFPLDRGGYTLNTRDHGPPRRPHFAQVDTDAPGTGEAYWNKDPRDDHAQDPLGRVRSVGGCWVNARVRICAR